MPNYRRNFAPGATYFFTVVTHGRERFLTDDLARPCLREAIIEVRKKRPSCLLASVLLPDHLHMVWTLPEDDPDFSIRWGQIKEAFTRRYFMAGGREGRRSASRMGRRERGIWQRRFWEHTCRVEEDLKRCVDYLHFNPVKHGLVRSVVDHPWSTFHRYVREGEYDSGWGREVAFPAVDGTIWD